MKDQSVITNSLLGNRPIIGHAAEKTALVEPKKIARDVYVAPVVRVAFYGYIATIPFETIALGIPLEITAISLGLLLLSLVFHIPLCLRRPPLAFSLFALYLVIFAIPVYTATPGVYYEEAKWQLLVIVQLVVMGWVAFNVMRSERAARGALLTLAWSCAVVALLQQTGISEVVSDPGGAGERFSSFGFHPNNIARILTVGLLAFAGMEYAMKRSVLKLHSLAVGAMAVIGLSIVQTGSRGALLALAAGLLVFTLKEGAVSTKVRNAAIVLIGIIFFTTLVLQTELSRSRFEDAVEQGDLARRDQIYPAAWKMFREKPLFGWGAKVSEYELGARLAHVDEDSKNPHNLVLFVLVGTGIAGAIPLLAGLVLTARAAWKARSGPRGVLPLSLITMVLVANLSGVWLHNKLHWFVTAYALSSTFIYPIRRKKLAASDTGRLVLER